MRRPVDGSGRALHRQRGRRASSRTALAADRPRPGVRHAPGTLAVVGGHLEVEGPGSDVLEATARREVAEEVGVDLTGTPLVCAESPFFVGDTGNRVVGVVFAAVLPDDAVPAVTTPEEVAGLGWWTLAELAAEPDCPAWTLQSVRRAAAVSG
ncbi:NUDIX domain-containing protein [Saccharothrix isguenensis]